MTDNSTTGPTLWDWLTNGDARRVFIMGGRYRFRWPWSRLLSVKEAKESGIFLTYDAKGFANHD